MGTPIATNLAITRFGVNEDCINTFVNTNTPYTTNTTPSQSVQSLPSFIASAQASVNSAVLSLATINNKGAWTTATVYAVKDIVSVTVSSVVTWYVCIVPHTSGATFAGDSATKWVVYQGVTTATLSGASGSNVVGFEQAGSSLVRSVQNKLQDFVSLSDFPGADPTGISDSTSALVSALSAGKPLILTGIYLISSQVTLPSSGCSIQGLGKSTGFNFTGSGGLSCGTIGSFYNFTNFSYIVNGSNPGISCVFPFTATPTPSVCMDKLWIAAGSTTTASSLLLLDTVRESTFSNLYFSTGIFFPNGLMIQNQCINLDFTNMVFSTLFSSSGITINGNNTAAGCQGINITNAILIGKQTGVVLLNNTDWISFVNVQIDNVVAPLEITGNHAELRFTNCQFGAATQGSPSVSVVQLYGTGRINKLVFENCSLINYDGTNYCVSNNSPSTMTVVSWCINNCQLQASSTQFGMGAPDACKGNSVVSSTTTYNIISRDAFNTYASANLLTPGTMVVTTAPIVAPVNGYIDIEAIGTNSNNDTTTAVLSANISGIQNLVLDATGISYYGLGLLPIAKGQSASITAGFTSPSAGSKGIYIKARFVPYNE